MMSVQSSLVMYPILPTEPKNSGKNTCPALRQAQASGVLA
jgi:hypothetical protein